MNRLLCPVLLTGLLPLTAAAKSHKPQQHPNIIYILADDLGYGDLSALNPDSKIHTEHIDSLAAQGISFTDAHTSSSVSTPSRYSILTGRYNWRSTLQSGVSWSYSAPLIEPERLTVAGLLHKAGYHTACIGKWHLGLGWQYRTDNPEVVDFTRPLTACPNDNGFDYSYIMPASLDIPPYVYIENGRITAPVTDTIQANGGYSFWREGPIAEDFDILRTLDHFTDKAVEYIKRQAADDSPFFLYFPLTAPHTPIIPSDPYRGKSGIGPYGDFVLHVDDVVGRIMEAVRVCGIEENTLIVFTSDNGCSPMANYKNLRAHGHNPSYIYRGAKADIYDGGHRVPYIIRYPAVVAAGSRSDVPVCLTGFMATCAELVGISLPDNAGEDSFSQLPLLRGKERPADRNRILIHHSHDGYFALRQGEWKLCVCPGSGGWSTPVPGAEAPDAPRMQLFDMSATPEEATTDNCYTPENHQSARMLRRLEKAIARGRTTPGPAQSNDTQVVLYKQP
ncbi:MAG TPA: arylsulfatase [Candidatus Rikenella faecigallinarum]|uniref:Arylsulfatase n=1 Tax=Candidatus Rikenella faecigallinarum TaxID=2838745 RepID=A0A9D1TZM6_9BACT|nr:arylsulfatase [Candidatus Rikenella faecigallinarum]